VRFEWFILAKKKVRRPHYHDLISDYDPAREEIKYVELAVEELFTEAQARQLKCFLDKYAGTTTIREAALPLPPDAIGYHSLPVGGHDDLFSLNHEPRYPLSFKVWGYYNLRRRDKMDVEREAGAFH
jgi:hypothetical protein